MYDKSDVRIIAVPYDSGHPGVRTGVGPDHLIKNGLSEELRSEGQRLHFETVRHESEPPVEIATAFELCEQVSDQVQQAHAHGEFPLILSGNCNTAVGTLAGAGFEDVGVVWFDSHGEFNTPETTTSGFLDGMGLAIATGNCWKMMAQNVPGFSPLPEDNVVMAGVREVDPMEQERLDTSDVTVIRADSMKTQKAQALVAALDTLQTSVNKVYVHLDVDVFDAAEVGEGNELATSGGPNAEEIELAFEMIRERFDIVAAGVASYNPAFDADERVLRTVITSVKSLLSPMNSSS